MSNNDGVIRISKKYHSYRLVQFPLSVRLGNVLSNGEFHTLGDLEGRRYAQIRVMKNCGSLLEAELQILLGRIEAGEAEELMASLPKFILQQKLLEEPPDETDEIIQIAAEHLPRRLQDFPLSTRLRNVLQREGFSTLEDINGLTYRYFINLQCIGQKTIDELRQLITDLQPPDGPAT